jgi:hypothetical protein
MAFDGFEKDRATLKYRYLAKHYGYECKGMKDCPVKSTVRIPLDVDRRIFTVSSSCGLDQVKET